MNLELVSLEQELSSIQRMGTLDAFGMYLYGVILRERDKNAEACVMLCASVNA